MFYFRITISRESFMSHGHRFMRFIDLDVEVSRLEITQATATLEWHDISKDDITLIWEFIKELGIEDGKTYIGLNDGETTIGLPRS